MRVERVVLAKGLLLEYNTAKNMCLWGVAYTCLICIQKGLACAGVSLRVSVGGDWLGVRAYSWSLFPAGVSAIKGDSVTIAYGVGPSVTEMCGKCVWDVCQVLCS